MPVLRISKNKVEQINQTNFRNERELQNLIETNMYESTL